VQQWRCGRKKEGGDGEAPGAHQRVDTDPGSPKPRKGEGTRGGEIDPRAKMLEAHRSTDKLRRDAEYTKGTARAPGYAPERFVRRS